MVSTPKRRWALEAARAMLGEVRQRTGMAVSEIEPLLAEREGMAHDAPERQALDIRIQKVISSWVRSMEALGVEVKGLWRVDFDNGSGYYCWQWPEEQLEYFHGYEEGFEGRSRIQ
jgi:hypothetical protein